MTTENNHPNNNDVQVSVVEQSPASETPATSEVAESTGGQIAETQSETFGSTEDRRGQIYRAPTEEHEDRGEHDAGHNHSQVANAGSSDLEHSTPVVDTVGISEPPVTPAAQMMAEEMFAATYPNGPTLMDEGVVRPFTDFIEEFRQTEVSLGSLMQEPHVEAFSGFPSITEPAASQPTPIDQAASITEHAMETHAVEEERQAPAPVPEAQPATNKERPVSPLLRPATRTRPARHGGRQREGAAAPTPGRAGTMPAVGDSGTSEEKDLSAAAVAGPSDAARTGESTAPAMPQQEPAPTRVPEEEQPKPTRRYRFDRPAPTSPVVPTQPVAQTRLEEGKENRVAPFASARSENGHPVEREAQSTSQPARQNGSATQQAEQQAAKQTSAQEPAANGEAASIPTPTTTPVVHGRRHTQERPREKEKGQPSLTPVAPADMASTTEGAESAAPAAQEVSPEDLPPLEYSELQAATSRRRRRRRTGSTSTTSAPASGMGGKPATPEQPSAGSTTPPVPTPVPASPVAIPRNAAAPGSAAPASQYNIVSGYTVSQMNQGNDGTGPFMGPEPSPARGSTMSREQRPIRGETPRGPAHVARHSEPMASPVSVSQLASVISQSFQSQTDRMIAELRRANQVPTNVSVSFPPFPSTERVGVFVDVANLLYSARTQRLTIDFGKLLDFLRGNRRLVRAQAYCPTSPQPGDEQMFLQAVKGLGYRITTKNYKIFSSGAKKADLDLDLCMDVVRLVDGRAVDCIVLVSGDSDFMPMLDYCSDHGVRVEVAAFDESMSATLRQSCDLFINLAMLDEIRA